MYSVPNPTPGNYKSYLDQPFLYSELVGVNENRYTADDLFNTSIPSFLGTNLLSTPTILDSCFLSMHSKPAGLGRALGGWIRVHDTNMTWKDLNPASGVFVDNGLGAYLTAAKAAGFKTLIMIVATPVWAASRPGEYNSGYGASYGISEPSNLSYLSAYITWLLTTYGSQIDALETWNEPKYDTTGGSYFSGTPSALAAMAKTVYQTAKAIKPSIIIMGPGTTGMMMINGGTTYGYGWTNSFLSAADGSGGFGKNWIDVLSIHTYTHDGNLDNRFMANLPALLAQLKSANSLPANFPVWATEFGALKFNATGDKDFELIHGTPEARMRWIIRYALWHVVSNIDVVVFYAYSSASMGWKSDSVMDDLWNQWVSIINGATVTCINRIGKSEALAATINGTNYIF